MKKLLIKCWRAFIKGFPPPLGSTVNVVVEEEPPQKVGRPRRDKALRRNVEYQSLMKQRRRLERKAHINGNKPVDQPTEVKYFEVCKRIDEIRESYGYEPRT
jgi:hypothetical protein